MLKQRLRSSGRAFFRTVSPRIWGGGEASGFKRVGLSNLRRNASNTWSAVQDTYQSTKQIFENHRVVFTIGTSMASLLTAWAGYCLRQIHQSNIEKRLMSLEESLKKSYNVENEEIKKIVSSGSVSTTACVATAWTTMTIGYVLGWRGGMWYANRKFRREQLKMMGHLKPRRFQLLKKPLLRFRKTQAVDKTASLPTSADGPALAAQQVNKRC